MITKSIAMDFLAYVDAACDNYECTPDAETVQAVKSVGAREFHAAWVEAMKAARWRTGLSKTDHETLMTPHMRRWELLVDAQRNPMIAIEEMSLEAQWEGDEEGDDDEE